MAMGLWGDKRKEKARDPDGPVLLTTVYNIVEADMIEALLRDNGIPVLRDYRGVALSMKILTGSTFGSGMDISVPAAAEEKARELLALLLAEDGDEEIDNEQLIMDNENDGKYAPTHGSAGEDAPDGEDESI